MTETHSELDKAHAAMEAAPNEDGARLRYYQILADTELCLLLRAEAQGDMIEPESFDLGDMRVVLVFDSEERLAQFTGAAAPYAAISGRVLAGMLAGQGLGLGVNLEAPSAFLVPPEGVAWLVDTLGHTPQEAEARIQALHRPTGLPAVVLEALAERLSRMAGLAQAAFLVGAEYHSGGRGHVLAILNAAPRAQAPLAKAMAEALTFSGIEAGTLDVVFIDDSHPFLPQFRAQGLALDIPQPPQPKVQVVTAPGSDPDKPPILR
ncbi:MAG: SseB family protein [Lutimaribacter sp.]